ncbi:MAG: hydrogenase maturation nickel metallochaperone HypA [Vicinamibacteraceae bacterium]|nr:hydrogenase maturation nickel metallochaperone HypA [Vicinamibacteraceae bacterium]
MHEYSIATSLMGHIERQARAHGATRVARVYVRIGELSGVEPDLLQTAYEILREGTLCDGAPLDIARVSVAWQCAGCGRPIAPGETLVCGDCGQPARLVAGDDITLDRLELEVPDV